MNATEEDLIWDKENPPFETFFFVISPLGVIGNVMVLIVILKSKQMRNSTNIYLLNLSIADLMYLLLATVVTLADKFADISQDFERVVKGGLMCIIPSFVKFMLMYASIITIMALTFERYYAICKPLRASNICTNKRAAIICVIVWFVSAVIASPIIKAYEIDKHKLSDGTEIETYVLGNYWAKVYFTVQLCLFFIPLIIMIVVYSIITKNLISNSNMIDADTVNTKNYVNVMRDRKQVVLMLVTIVLSFFLCFLPTVVFWIIAIVFEVDIQDFFGEHRGVRFLYATKSLLCLHSAVNPLLYNVISSKFRREFAKLLGIDKLMRCCWKPNGNNVSVPNNDPSKIVFK